MSRAAVLSALRSDATLLSLVAAENILPNYSREGRPSNLAPDAFIILRWEESQANIGRERDSDTRTLTVWAHYPAELSTDFGRVDAVLSAVKDVLVNLEHAIGPDGYTVTCVEYQGKSGDMKDDGFDTISRNSTFKVLSRASA